MALNDNQEFIEGIDGLLKTAWKILFWYIILPASYGIIIIFFIPSLLDYIMLPVKFHWILRLWYDVLS